MLLGPTGAGKTTTLRLIAGLERPDAGPDRDRRARRHRERRRRRATSPWSSSSSRSIRIYSVFDNLAFPLRSPLRRESEDRIERPGARDRRRCCASRASSTIAPPRLSGGEMQRVAIGRALVRRPRVYLMDEPLSSLDAKLREDLRIELKRIQRELGATILYVTHDQIEAMTMADRIGVIEEGRLAAAGHAARDLRPARQYRRCPSPGLAADQPAAHGRGARQRSWCRRHHGVRPEDVEPGRPRNRGPDRAGGAAGRRDRRPAAARRVPALHALMPGLARVEAGATTRIAVAPEAMLFFAADGRRLAA